MSQIMLSLDLLALVLAWPVVTLTEIAPALGGLRSPAALAGLLYPVCSVILFYASGLYRRDVLLETRKSLARAPAAIGMGVAAASVLAGGVLSGLKPWPQLLAMLTHVALVACICLLLCSVAARAALRVLRRRGMIRRRVLVVGAGTAAWDLVWLMQSEGRHLDYDILFAHEPVFGQIDPRLAEGGYGEIVLISNRSIRAIAEEFGADQIVVAPDERRGMRLQELLSCKTAGIPVQQYLSFIESETRRIDLKRMELGWLLYSDGFYFGSLDRLIKRGLDVGISLLLLALSMPVLLAAMIAIKLDDGGPIFYSQTRVTRGSRDFPITKLRTMRVDAEAQGAVWAAARDIRVTRVGSFLRRTRIDEIPQLFCILRGDMSLVGPRPERPAFVTMLSGEIPLYNERHLVKAGLTGWAQVNYPYGASVDDARSKLSYDLYYIKNFSVLLDLRIILQTLRVVLWPGASVR